MALEPGKVHDVTDTRIALTPGFPDLAIDGFQGTVNVNGMVRLTLYRVRYDPLKEDAVRDIVGTLSMTEKAAASFSLALADALDQHGIKLKPAAPSEP